MRLLALCMRRPDSGCETLLLRQAPVELPSPLLPLHSWFSSIMGGKAGSRTASNSVVVLFPTCMKHAVYALLAPVGSQMG